MRKRRIGLVLLWLLATAIVVIILDHVFGPVIPSWRVERAISRFQAAPSQANAAALAHLLETHTGNEEQIRRALSLLLQPHIVTRKTYHVGQGVWVSVEQPFAPDSENFLWQSKDIFVGEHIAGHGQGPTA